MDAGKWTFVIGTVDGKKQVIPTTYRDASSEYLEANTGGCGPGRGIGDWLVPDSIVGQNIKSSCKVHDLMYFEGETEEDRFVADLVLIVNLLLIVSDGGLLDIPQERIALTYYQAVRHGGKGAFQKGITPSKDDVESIIESQNICLSFPGYLL